MNENLCTKAENILDVLLSKMEGELDKETWNWQRVKDGAELTLKYATVLNLLRAN